MCSRHRATLLAQAMSILSQKARFRVLAIFVDRRLLLVWPIVGSPLGSFTMLNTYYHHSDHQFWC